jgi:hypothetical protein
MKLQSPPSVATSVENPMGMEMPKKGQSAWNKNYNLTSLLAGTNTASGNPIWLTSRSQPNSEVFVFDGRGV